MSRRFWVFVECALVLAALGTFSWNVVRWLSDSRSARTREANLRAQSPEVSELPGEDKDDESRRHLEKAGGFSFIPPSTWKVRDYPGLKYKIVVGPIQAGFASNINVVDESFEGSLDAYVEGNTAVQMRALKKVQIVKQEKFRTTSGLQGARSIIEDEQDEQLLRQTFYFFGTAETKYVITCSTLAEGGERLDPIFERAMRTFRFEKP
jgi:hypothetical protein